MFEKSARKECLIIISLLWLLCSCSTLFIKYIYNPVINDYVYHDSSLIDGGDGYFYSFVSSIVPRDSAEYRHYYTVSIFRSKDLIHWSFYKYALAPTLYNQKPIGEYDIKLGKSGLNKVRSNEKNKSYAIWAPEITKYKGRYLLFAACHKSLDDTKIALYESESLDKDFQFVNTIVSSDKADNEMYFNSREQIDPFVFIENERIFLVFGSFSRDANGTLQKNRQGFGVYIVELAPNNKYAMKGEPVFLTDYYEGVQILKHDGQYFLFGTNGSLSNSTYKISYAKSNNLFGPYINSEGKSISDTVSINFGTPMIQTTEEMRYNGFGCPSLPITDKRGRQYMLVLGHAPEYEPLQANKAENERYTFLLELLWDNDGNPYFDLEAILNNTQIAPRF